MTTKLLYSIISLILIVGAPVAFVLYLKRMKGIKLNFWSILAGIVVEFLVKEALLKLVIYVLAMIPGIKEMLTNSIIYSVITILLTSLLLIGMLVLAIKVYLGGNFNIDSACSLALGTIIADTMMSFLMPAFSNIIYISKLNNGTLFDSLTEYVTAEQANIVIDMYNGYPNSYFIYFGIIAVACVCSNYLITILLSNSMNDRKSNIRTVLLAIIVTTAIYYYANPLTFTFTNVVLIVLAILMFLLADKRFGD